MRVTSAGTEGGQGLAWAVGTTSCVAVAHLSVAWSTWHPWGASESTLVVANVGFALLACLIVAAAGLALLAGLGKERADAAGSGGAYGAVIVVGIIAADIFLYWVMHDAGIRKITSRGDQIVAAIGRFEDDHGRAPDTLEQLVPAYIPAIPLTDTALCPEFSYGRDGQSWELAVGLTQWILDDTRLLYRSDGRDGACADRAWALCG